MSTLLSQRPGDPQQQRELLEIIDEEAERMRQWIDDAVRISSHEAGEIRLAKAPNRVKDAVARAVEGLGLLLDGRVLEVEIDESLPLAMFDAELMEKVIWQLLDNAIKYSSAGSPIRVSAEFTGAEIVVSVADSGCGIPKRDQQRIFEKYYRGRAAGHACFGHRPGAAEREMHHGGSWRRDLGEQRSGFRLGVPHLTAGGWGGLHRTV